MADEATPAVPETPAPEVQKTPGEALIAKLAETPPVETTPAAPSLAERLKSEFGFENVANDTEAVERLIEFNKQTKAEYGQKVADALAELRTLKGTTQAEQPPPPAEQSTGWKWEPPAVDMALVQQYRTADGWKPETPPQVRQQAEAWQAYHDKWANGLVRDPMNTLVPLIEDRARKIAEEMLQRTTVAQREAEAQKRIVADNPWLWDKNPVTGQPDPQKLSAEGQRMNQWMLEMANLGGSFEQQWQYAMEKRELEQYRAKQNSAGALETAEQKKRELLARGLPERSGSIPKPGEPGAQNKRISSGQQLVQRLQREGVPLP